MRGYLALASVIGSVLLSSLLLAGRQYGGGGLALGQEIGMRQYRPFGISLGTRGVDKRGGLMWVGVHRAESVRGSAHQLIQGNGFCWAGTSHSALGQHGDLYFFLFGSVFVHDDVGTSENSPLCDALNDDGFGAAPQEGDVACKYPGCCHSGWQGVEICDASLDIRYESPRHADSQHEEA